MPSPEADRSPLIAFDKVSKVFGTGPAAVRALDRVDLEIGAGEFVAIMGPSGSGKSTAMNIMGCLDTPSAGRYAFKGVDVGKLERRQRALIRRHFIGFVFQGFNLLPRTSAIENVELPLIYRGLAPSERRRVAAEALEKVGLTGWGRHTPAELSGGQQQRTAIARAIVTEPALVLADEPTGNLDTAKGREIMQVLQSLNREHSITVVMVTHDQAIARYAARTVLFVDGRIASDERNDKEAA